MNDKVQNEVEAGLRHIAELRDKLREVQERFEVRDKDARHLAAENTELRRALAYAHNARHRDQDDLHTAIKYAAMVETKFRSVEETISNIATSLREFNQTLPQAPARPKDLDLEEAIRKAIDVPLEKVQHEGNAP